MKIRSLGVDAHRGISLHISYKMFRDCSHFCATVVCNWSVFLPDTLVCLDLRLFCMFFMLLGGINNNVKF